MQTTQVERQPVDPREFPPVQPQDGTPPIPAPPPAPQTQQAPASDEIATRVEQGTDWSWLVWLAAVLAVLAGAAVFWKRRQANGSAPEIEKPVVGGASFGIGPVGAGQVSGDALTIRCSAEKLIRSAAFATLKYRLTLVNRTDGPLSDVSVGIDLVSAHAGSPMEDQVATPATALEIRHTLARISPRQNVTVEGQVQLPLAGAQVIRQGRHPLLVPLMRVRVDGAGEEPMVKTFVVGQGEPGGGRVQPFRLDEGPRSYAPIAHRELA
ncbi:hypothetical protein [Qipengyuania zhejiangensis]|uniref:hypothetical protein n=1 Tax=Qipengyuania zhejiangensis TaxID=3077782 RepID=UPI002D780186|nr:hypothetical protein [Qipengyuania sp. Z2]